MAILPLRVAVVIPVQWGLALLTGLSFVVAPARELPVLREIAKHVAVAAVVILGSKMIGHIVSASYRVKGQAEYRQIRLSSFAPTPSFGRRLRLHGYIRPLCKANESCFNPSVGRSHRLVYRLFYAPR